MKPSSVLTIVLALLGLPILSHGISRVGNGGVMSQVNGYTLSVPMEFSNVQFYADENTRMFNINAMFASLKAIDLRKFATEYPELTNKSSDDIQSSLLSSGWQVIVNHNFCGKLFFQETATTQAYIAVWGRGITCGTSLKLDNGYSFPHITEINF
ncbi:MAG: hypothetical protein ACXVO1_10240 [Tumebacillaceae bacterium]